MSNLLRVKCPFCGKVQDIPYNCQCRKCGKGIILPEDGVIQVYRMGNLMGMALRMRMYLNEIHLGYLGNMESIRIPVPYGHYTFRMKNPEKGIRRCYTVGVEFDITPNNRFVYLKAHSIPGAINSTVVVEQVPADQMPPL